VGTGVRPFGVLCATDRVDGSAFAAEDLALLRLLAAQVGQLLAPDFGGDARPRGPADALQKLGEPASSESAGRVAEAELARTVCDALTSEIEPDRLITASLSAVSQSLAAAPVALYLIDNQSGRLCLEAQIDGGGLADHASFERMRGLTGLVLQTGQPVAADHPDRDARFDAEVDTPLDGAVRPLICAPVKMRGKTMGLVRAFLKDGATASAATAEVVSAVISAAVRNVFLYRSLLESIDEVARVRRDQRSRR
jgi:GAF domain-containing protein